PARREKPVHRMATQKLGNPAAQLGRDHRHATVLARVLGPLLRRDELRQQTPPKEQAHWVALGPRLQHRPSRTAQVAWGAAQLHAIVNIERGQRLLVLGCCEILLTHRWSHTYTRRPES